MKRDLLIYGSYGYTGDLIARQAIRRGLRPILSGRDGEKLRQQAAELDLPWRQASLYDSAALDAALNGIGAVLHCAGPFSNTYHPMVHACLRRHAHYLDITGEIAVFEALARLGAEAKIARIALLPGVGFDVVPSDCLAAHLKNRLPSARKLSLAFKALGQASQGTAKTVIEGLAKGGLVRRGGKLTRVPAAWKVRLVDFGRGPRSVVTIPWGDISTAYYSTGIPNIETYVAMRAPMRLGLASTTHLGPFFTSSPVQALLKSLVSLQPPGPSEAQRQHGVSLLWGEVLDAYGNRCVSRLRTPEAYNLTAQTAVAAAEGALAGGVQPGFQTPSLAFGPDFILQFEGVIREDTERSI